MAKALTLRQVAKNFQAQADLYSRLAKQLNIDAKALPQAKPQGSELPVDDLSNVIAAYDKAIRAYYTADGQQQQADAYTAQADAAYAAGDTTEAP